MKKLINAYRNAKSVNVKANAAEKLVNYVAHHEMALVLATESETQTIFEASMYLEQAEAA